ncbi:hypothetical protein OPS25_11670 [Alteromonas ponticola]|uniref:Tetratricopeptide repeat protein n=1 Tax=Alteromonas aquimaris TaxID=2998417 RepID=A0ABT3PAQ8_9ALTE|nr:hypothetical protein [Alteromonas aquimaris]MCW8109156.1 hypothetical protein [Alteromonas aquimaris]
MSNKKIYIFFLLLKLITISSFSDANVQESYENERSRILRLDHFQVYEALENSKIYDKNSPIGKYFYNSIIRFSHMGNEQLFITLQDEEDLKKTYPAIFLEYLIKKNIESDESIDEKIAKFESYAAIAEKERWPRVFRYSMAWLVEFEVNNFRDSSALVRMYQLLDKAPVFEYAEIAIDYPLQSLYFDIAVSLNRLGRHSDALQYCHMLRELGAKNSDLKYYSTQCKIHPLLALGRSEDALKLLYEEIKTSRETADHYSLVINYISTARALIGSNKLDQAEVLINDALIIQKNKNYDGFEGYAPEYMLLADIFNKKGDFNKAERYLSLSKSELKDAYSNVGMELRYLNIEQNILEKREYYSEALKIAKKAVEISLEREQKFPYQALTNLINKLNERQIRHLNKTESLTKLREASLITALIFLAILFVFVLYSLKNILSERKDSKINSMYDIASGTLSFSSWKSNAIKLYKTKIDFFLVLIETGIDRNLLKYEESTFDFIKNCKYQLLSDEKIARYNETTYVLKLSASSARDCNNRLNDILHKANSESKLPVRYFKIPFPRNFMFGRKIKLYLRQLKQRDFNIL